MSILIYFLFFLCAFLLGFFGLAPIIILDILSDKMPYIILVVLGYTTLIVLFVLWQNGYLSKLQNKDTSEEDGDAQEDLDVEATSEETDEDKKIETIEELHEKVEELVEKVEASLEEQGIEVVNQVKESVEDIEMEQGEEREDMHEAL